MTENTENAGGAPGAEKVRKKKPANEVGLTFAVYSRGLPASGVINLREHSLHYCDDEFRPVEQTPGLINGVFGIASKQQVLVAASAWAKKNEFAASGANRVLLVDVNYKIEDYKKTRDQLTASIVAETGWVHFERLATTYREEVKETWLGWMRRDYNDQYIASLARSEVSLLEIARRHPKYISRMMQEDPNIRAIVHPVRPLLSPDMVILTATVRYKPEYFGEANVRFLPNIKVVI